MSDIRKLLESIDSMATESKVLGPKFPGYWKGQDSAKKAKSRMVGSTEESILPEIAKQVAEGAIHRRLEEAWENFKSVNEETVTINGKTYNRADIDRELNDPSGFPMRMPDEPQFVQTLSGPLVSGDGTPVRTGTDKPGKIVRIKPDSSGMDIALGTNNKPEKTVKEPVAVASPVPPRGPITSVEKEIGSKSDTDVSNFSEPKPVQQRAEPGTPADLVELLKARQAIEQAKDANYKPVSLNRNFAISALAKMNNIRDPNQIKAGDTIKLIDANGQYYYYRIAPGDNLWNISRGKLRGQRF